MEESVLLGTKPLVDSIRHFIRDPSGVFSVCHLCECRIVQWRHDSRLLLLLNCFLTSRLLFRIKAWRAGLRPSAKKKLKSLQKNLKTRTRRRKHEEEYFLFAIKPSRICKTWLLWNTINRKYSIFSLHIIKRTLHVGSTIWILCSRGKNNISLVCFAHLWDIVLATRT